MPPNLPTSKLQVFRDVQSVCGYTARNIDELAGLPDDLVPVVSPRYQPVAALVHRWRCQGRPFVYWDRGYVCRGGKTWLGPTRGNQGHYRFHFGAFQMPGVMDVPGDRWGRLRVWLRPWRRTGRHVVIAAPSDNYARFHRLGDDWVRRTVSELRKVTGRPLVVRMKDASHSLAADLAQSHCLVTHGSNAAVEAVALGCPVFVDPVSAAAPVGRTDIRMVDDPVYPDRMPWARALAYSQWTRDEIVDGTMWRLLRC